MYYSAEVNEELALAFYSTKCSPDTQISSVSHISPVLYLAVAVLLAVIIILLTGALAIGLFLNYRRTGSLIPSMPKLPRYSITLINQHSNSSAFFDLEEIYTKNKLAFILY